MTVHVGFAGAGGIAELHMTNLARLDDVRITAVSDTDPVRASRLADHFGAAVHYNAADMLSAEKLDCLYVCLPPFAHADLELRAADAGVHLFIEKPLGLSPERTAEKVRRLTESGLIVSVGYHWRYFEHTDTARKLLADRPVALLLGTWLSGMPETPWWRQRARSGGQLLEQNTHMVDLARYFAGNVHTVQAGAFSGILAPEVSNYDIDDASAVIARFRKGPLGVFLATDLFPGFDTGLKVFARDLMLHLTLDGLVIHEKGKRTEIRTSNDPYELEDRIFIDAVRTGDPSAIRSTYDDAFRTFLTTTTANDAMKSTQTLPVLEQDDLHPGCPHTTENEPGHPRTSTGGPFDLMHPGPTWAAKPPPPTDPVPASSAAPGPA